MIWRLSTKQPLLDLYGKRMVSNGRAATSWWYHEVGG